MRTGILGCAGKEREKTKNPITMRRDKTEELHFINKLDKNGMKINIGNQYAYNVQYSAENLCRGEFTAEVFSKQNPEQFSIKIVQQATFSYDPALSKEEIHRLTYKEIFPYVRAAITGVTAGAGIPPIYIPYVDIAGQDIYRIELPGKV